MLSFIENSCIFSGKYYCCNLINNDGLSGVPEGRRKCWIMVKSMGNMIAWQVFPSSILIEVKIIDHIPAYNMKHIQFSWIF